MNIQTKQRKSAGASQLVKIGTSRQVAIPKKIYEQLHLGAGDYLEVEIKKDHIVLTPQVFIEKRLAEGLKDIKEGKEIGPFLNMDDAVKALNK